MTLQKFSSHLATVSAAIALGLSITHVPTLAQNAQPVIQKVAVTWTPPDRSAPSQTEGAASRDEGKCSDNEEKPNPPLTALMPNNTLVLTLAERPTFFVYVPPISARTAEFVLKDENEDDVYKTTITLPSQPGIISIAIPANVKPLENGKTYRWYFDLVCNSGKRVFVDRIMVQRTEPSATLANELKQATNPRDRAAVYAKNGIWYDTLQTLAALRHSSPNDATLTNEWKELLESAGIQEVSDKPLINCCTATN